MTPEDVLQALGLPPEARIDQRVPKTLLVEHGAPTAADKRHINEGIEELRWVATLKPATVGVNSYSDMSREVVELSVLALRLRPKAKAGRIIELVHRAIPYHLMLITETEPGKVNLSLADKRWAQNEAGKTVLDSDLVQADLQALTDEVRGHLLEALSLARQPRTTLYTLYRGWIDTLIAAQAARVTGGFNPAQSPEQAADRRKALETCTALQTRMASLRSAAAKEKQLAKQVQLNLELKRLKAEYDEASQRL